MKKNTYNPRFLPSDTKDSSNIPSPSGGGSIKISKMPDGAGKSIVKGAMETHTEGKDPEMMKMTHPKGKDNR